MHRHRDMQCVCVYVCICINVPNLFCIDVYKRQLYNSGIKSSWKSESSSGSPVVKFEDKDIEFSSSPNDSMLLSKICSISFPDLSSSS